MQTGILVNRIVGVSAVGYRDLTPAQVEFWSGSFARMVQDEAWKKDLARYSWEHDYRNAAETVKFLDERTELLARILSELGRVKTIRQG